MWNNRLKRHKRIRRKISGTGDIPRVAVFRSNKHIQAQLVDDEQNKTLFGMSTYSTELKGKTKSEKAKELGQAFGKKVVGMENGRYLKIVFDRGGVKYHGRVKAFAEGLRESGLKF